METGLAYELIAHALDSGRVAHGYLVVGGVRGEAMALTLRVLKRIFPDCADVHSHPDVHWLQPEKTSRIISVDAVREKLVGPMETTAFSGGWKAGVIVGADRLKTEGANAFLKTLEEPPPKTLFFLLTENPEQILPTIVSRCQRIDLADARSRDLPEPWKTRLVDALADGRLTSAAARAAAAGDLAQILEELKASAESLVKDERGDASGEEATKDVFKALVSSRYRELRADFLAALEGWFRDLMALAAARGADVPLVHEGRRATLAERASRLTPAQAFRNVDAVEEFAASLERNVQEPAALSFLADRLNFGVEAKK